MSNATNITQQNYYKNITKRHCFNNVTQLLPPTRLCPCNSRTVPGRICSSCVIQGTNMNMFHRY